MRNFLSMLIGAVLLVAASTTTTMAQGMMRMSPEERAKALKDSLTLTDKQTEQVAVIFKDMGAKRQAMMDSLDDRDARREAMMKLMSQVDEKIETLLTPEQKNKYEAMRKEREARFRRGPN